jgi:regulator of protease activity HflC (stomatin/prohibitin superfamily)
MDRNEQRIGLVNLVIFLVMGGLAFGVARYGETAAGQTAAIFIGLGFLVAAVSWFQMRLEEQERLEKLEFDELKRRATSGTLFERTPDAETFPAQRSREQFERFFVPVFTVVLCVLQAAGAVWTWLWLNRTPTHEVRHQLAVMGAFGFIFLVALLFGVYSSSAAKLGKVRLLRPGAGYLLLSSYLSLLVCIGVVLVWLDFRNVDYYVARALSAALGIVAAESLINLILELYRPRVKGRVARPIYESRLVGLMGTPGGLVSTAAQAMDYQFGFKVSETWFYKFLEQRLVWLLLLQLVILLASTCVVFVEPGEQGLIERLGRRVAARPVLEAGPHLKLPWPIDTVHRFPVRQVQSLNIGFQPDPAKEKEQVVLWTVPHYKEEFNLLVASRDTNLFTARGGALTNTANQSTEKIAPVYLLTVGMPLQFEITNVVAWAYDHADPTNLLSQIATREVVRHLASVDLFEVMSGGQLAGAEALRSNIQASANQRGLGVNILFLGLHDIHPPTEAAAAFQSVVSAQLDAKTNILRAQGMLASTTLVARAEAEALVREAEGAAALRTNVAAAMAAQFSNQMVAYQASPEIYRARVYLQALAEGSANARKIVVAPTNTEGVLMLNLEDRVRSDIRDVTIPAPR